MATVVPGRESLARPTALEGLLRYLPGVALCGVATLLVTAFWLIRTLNSPYWLDETATYWATNAGWAEIPARCALFPLSLPYAGLILALRTAFGSGEAVARIPSLVSIGLAAYLLFRDVRTRWGSNAAWIAAVVFVSMPDVIFLAGDARPYAIGLLFAVLSTSLLMRLCGRPAYTTAALYALTAALMVHLQILFGAVLAAHFLYIVLKWRGGRLPVRHLVSAAVLLLILVSPIALELRSLRGHPESHSFAAAPGISDFLDVFFPIPVMAGALGAAAASILLVADSRLVLDGYSEELILAALIAFLPPLFAFAASRAVHLGVFLGRYFIGCAIGVAVCCGVLLGSLRSARAARAVMFCIAVCQISSIALLLRKPAQGHGMHRGDWAAAIAFTDKNTAADGAPVLIRSQYIESDFYPIEPVNDNPMFSQLVRYPSRSRMTGLRCTLNETEVDQTLNSVRNGGAFHGRLLLLSYDGPKPLDAFVTFLAGRLGPAFQLRELGDFDGIHVLEFQKGR